MFITGLFCLCYASLCECDVLSMYTDILVLEICFLIYWHGFYRAASVPPPASLAHSAHLGALIEGTEKGDQCLWANQEILWICVLFSLCFPFFTSGDQPDLRWPHHCVIVPVLECVLWKCLCIRVGNQSVLRYFPLFTSIISLLLFTFWFSN